MKLSLWLNRFWPVLLGSLLCAAAHALPVSHLQVRIVTGGQDLSAGSVFGTAHLRSRQGGASAAVDAWRIVAARLDARHPPDPERVRSTRATCCASACTIAPPVRSHRPGRWLPPMSICRPVASRRNSCSTRRSRGRSSGRANSRLSERDVSTMTCVTDSDCDDQRSCNGHERCAPRTAGADARGCVRGSPVVCPVNQVCSEGRGCIGADSAKTLATPK